MTDEARQARTVALARFLAEFDEACPSCRYSLRGLNSSKCPECSQLIELGVRLVEPRLASFIFGVVGLSVGSGFCTILLLWALVILLTSGYFGPLLMLLPLALGAVLGAVLLPAWIRARRRLALRSNTVRWVAACGVTAVSLVFPLCFFVMQAF